MGTADRPMMCTGAVRRRWEARDITRHNKGRPTVSEVNKDEQLEDLEPENSDEIKGGTPAILNDPERVLDKPDRVIGAVKRRTRG